MHPRTQIGNDDFNALLQFLKSLWNAKGEILSKSKWKINPRNPKFKKKNPQRSGFFEVNTSEYINLEHFMISCILSSIHSLLGYSLPINDLGLDIEIQTEKKIRITWIP